MRVAIGALALGSLLVTAQPSTAASTGDSAVVPISGATELIWTNTSPKPQRLALRLEVDFGPGAHALVITAPAGGRAGYALISQPTTTIRVDGDATALPMQLDADGEHLVLTRTDALARGAFRIVLDTGVGLLIYKPNNSVKLSVSKKVTVVRSGDLEATAGTPSMGMAVQARPISIRQRGDLLFVNPPCDAGMGVVGLETNFTDTRGKVSSETLSCTTGPTLRLKPRPGVWTLSGQWAGRTSDGLVALLA